MSWIYSFWSSSFRRYFGEKWLKFLVFLVVCLTPGNVGMSPGMRVAQLLNVAFDMCAWEVLGALCNGCTLCIRGKSSKEWRAVMKTVDIIIATPSILGKRFSSILLRINSYFVYPAICRAARSGGLSECKVCCYCRRSVSTK